MFPPTPALALSVALALTLTACAGVQRVSGTATAGTAGTASSPTAPTASDGTDLTACADGSCEVVVAAPVDLPVPASTGVEGLRVESISAPSGEVAFAGRGIGTRNGGSCTGRCRVSSKNGVFGMTLGPGSTGRQNGLAVTLVAVTDDAHAVVRLRAG